MPTRTTQRTLPTGGFNRERTPRPLGVASGVPWEPRLAERAHAGATLTSRFLEWLEHYPGLQGIGAAWTNVLHSLFVRDSYPAPTDTADEPGAWRFAAIGDYGTGSVHQARVAANILRRAPELVLTVGDNVYPTGRWQDYAKNFDPPHLMGTLVRKVPFMPALGNHDLVQDDLRPYFGHFPHLKGRPYYSYTHKNAHFIALDGDQDLRAGSAQLRWLEKELQSSDKQWRVVYLHYPIYSSQGGFDEIRKAVQPLLAKYNVQLVLAGHEHDYQRSHAVDGVTHVLTGGGGQQVWNFTKKAPGFIAFRKAAYHHTEVSVSGTRLVVRAIDENGKLIDSAVIPGGGPAQARMGVSALEPARARRRSPARRSR